MINIIKIISKDNYITKEQIQKCINLLPNKYKNLDIKIIFVSNKWHSLKYIYFWNKLKHIFNGSLRGSSSDTNNKILIFSCNFELLGEYSGLEKLKLIQTLYHEIRHQWQRQKMKKEYNQFVFNKKYLKETPYDNQWQEIDARNFSNHFMNKCYNKVEKIFDI